MKKLLCVLLVFIFNFSVFAQTESYLYERYGIVNQYTNNTVLPIDGTLKFIKNKDDLFTIQMTDSQLENTFVYELTVSLNGYDELDEKYIYIGNVVREGVAKGKCIISTSNKLDIYLNNKGYEYKGGYYDNDFHENLSLSVYFKNMKISEDGYISSIPDTYIKIYPIRNISKEEKEAIVLFNQKQKKLIEKEQEEIDNDYRKQAKELVNKMVAYLKKDSTLPDFDDRESLFKVPSSSNDFYVVTRDAYFHSLKLFKQDGAQETGQIKQIKVLAGDINDFYVEMTYTSTITYLGETETMGITYHYRIKKGKDCYLVAFVGYRVPGDIGLVKCDPVIEKDVSTNEDYAYSVGGQ